MRAGKYSGTVLVILAASAGAARADLVDDCYRATVASPVSNERIIQVCTQALQVTARDKRWRVLANRAVGYMQKGDLDAAIADFNEAIALNPDPWARSSRANAFRLKGDFDRALQELNELIRLNPRDAIGAYVDRGQVHLDRGDLASARADFQAALGMTNKDAAVERWAKDTARKKLAEMPADGTITPKAR